MVMYIVFWVIVDKNLDLMLFRMFKIILERII